MPHDLRAQIRAMDALLDAALTPEQTGQVLDRLALLEDAAATRL